jgi:hypothetical protein
MKSAKRNIAESVRARLLNLSTQDGDEFRLTLANYVIERFLYRLGQSPLRDRFVLKGAVLFRVWMGQTHRPTKDIDLLGNGSSEISQLAQAIREDAEYKGVRIRFRAELAAARIPLQIDVGFGMLLFGAIIDDRSIHARHGASPSPRVSARDHPRHIQHSDDGLL